VLQEFSLINSASRVLLMPITLQPASSRVPIVNVFQEFNVTNNAQEYF